ncbi:MAG: ATP-binding cassette domain-containing protein [Bacteroidales bacterium]|nr:ATP-binding cassette domain-containing protein [Bacteroidales bacterium]
MLSAPVIHLTNATVYRNLILTLSEVEFQVFPGEFIYLVGKTGSGKTSLLKTLYAELFVDEGEATIAGFDLLNLKVKEIPFLRRKLGIVFQDFQLLTDRTVQKNLEFVMRSTGWRDKEKIQKRAHEVLSLVGIPTKGFKMPHELSGGEQQRVCIARALINQPEIILADEPTGNLDPETAEEIVALLYEISKQGKSVIVATHNHFMIDKFPGRVVRMDRGKVISS